MDDYPKTTCKECNQDQVMLEVTISASNSSTGKAKKKAMPVDACIADIIKALNENSVLTKSCCCGHNKCNGSIFLYDGRAIYIQSR